MTVNSEPTTLFEKWVLFILFQSPNASLTNETLMIQCCDTALDGLTEEKVSNNLHSLVNNGYIKANVINPNLTNPQKYQISGKGILYVRQNMLKPITDLIQRDDYQKVLQHVNSPIGNHIDEIKTDVVAENNGFFDKSLFNNKFVAYAVNNIGPVIGFIEKILTFVK